MTALFGQQILGLGDDLLAWLLLAFGGALVAGNALALIRPPKPQAGELGGQPTRPPLGRTLVMIAVGAVATIWAIASLVQS